MTKKHSPMKTYKIFLAGEFISTTNVLDVVNPYTDEIFAKTYLAGNNDLENAIEAAQNVTAELKNMPIWKRAEILFQIANRIKAKKKYLAGVLADEAGKPMKYALGEIERALQTFWIAAEECKRLPAEILSIDWTPAGANKEAFVKYFPVGLIAAIAPFNFPLNLAVHKLAPAIATGNPVILKPARSTPLSVLELAHIIERTDLPKGAVSILPMDRETGNLLVTDKRFKMLTFTGSPQIGWQMKQNCGKKKITLELGGNAGVIVSPTAKLQYAVNRCVMGGFSYSGQVCIHVQRIYVHSSIINNFIRILIAETEKLKSGNPRDIDTDISVMIDKENAKRVEEWVNEAVERGAKILHGGKRIGSFYSPTLITNTHDSMKVCSQEVFGPVVIIEAYEDFKSAVNKINNSCYGLQAGVFTDKISEMDYAFKNIEAGGIIINDVPTFRVDHMPYGGVKDSGFGREGVKYAMFEMLEPRLLVKHSEV